MSVKSTNLVAVTHRVSQEERWKAHGHRGGVLWFTGLPGSGKSTLALELEQRLFKSGRQVYVLDGDNVRHGLSSDLGFSPEDRTENIRRIGEVAALFANAGMIVLTAFISPYRADRDLARKACGDAFHEVYVSAPLEVCEDRDPKGHYKMAREGKIPEFTGVSAPYEAPLKAEFTVDTGAQSLDQSADDMVTYIEKTFSV